jgi:hypothetical protein
VNLSMGETVTIEYVHERPWGGFCTYLGGQRSLVQLNLDRPKKILALLDLACHEAYPGHHTNFVLVENALVVDSGWVEHTIGPLYVPWAVVCEGTAMVAMELAFPRTALVEYAREVLFPLASLDVTEIERYLNVIDVRNRLWHVEMDVARDYLDGNIDKNAAMQQLQVYLGMTDDDARGKISFYDTYRSYIVTYYIGSDLVREYINASAGETRDPDEMWKAFADLLKLPVTPSDLINRVSGR